MPDTKHIPYRGSWWKHLKTGHLYKVICCSRHTETEEWLVTYSCNKDGSLSPQQLLPYDIWTRPAKMFMDGRFEKICSPEPLEKIERSGEDENKRDYAREFEPMSGWD